MENSSTFVLGSMDIGFGEHQLNREILSVMYITISYRNGITRWWWSVGTSNVVAFARAFIWINKNNTLIDIRTLSTFDGAAGWGTDWGDWRSVHACTSIRLISDIWRWQSGYSSRRLSVLMLSTFVKTDPRGWFSGFARRQWWWWRFTFFTVSALPFRTAWYCICPENFCM